VLDTGTYPKGIKISDQEMRQFGAAHLAQHEFHGDWNYTIAVRTSQHTTRPDEQE
jgi:Rhodopirellula transposase DDE domain